MLRLGFRGFSTIPRSIAVTCPGQGLKKCDFLVPLSKYKDLVKNYSEELDESLQIKLSSKLFDPSKETNEYLMQNNDYFQPSLVFTTYINYIILKNVFGIDILNNDKVKFILGHSLGEYTAHLLAGSISLKLAVQIAHLRGKLSKELATKSLTNSNEKFGMKAIICDKDKFQELVDFFSKQGILANINSTTQLTISGYNHVLEESISQFNHLTKSPRKNLMRILNVPATVPFHTEIVRPFEKDIEKLISLNELSRMQKPLISNLDGKIVETAREGLLKTVKSNSRPVQWVKSMETLRVNGITDVIHLGPGTILHDLNKRQKDINISSISIATELEMQNLKLD